MMKVKNWGVWGAGVLFCLSVLVFLGSGCAERKASSLSVLRVGHFPTVTHAPALMARMSGKKFEESVGSKIEWVAFNAGPAVVEALFAGSIDIAYVGPNPAINAYLQSKGEALRIVAGVASGGSALVVQADDGITKDSDFSGKIIGTPQIGNTQDVAARLWFRNKGYRTRDRGGDLDLVPLAPSEQNLLFSKKEISAVWTIEPWVSFIEKNYHGRVYLDERSLWPDGRYATACLVVRRGLLQKTPDLVKRFIAAHVDFILQLRKEPDLYRRMVGDELRLLGYDFSDEILTSAMERVSFTWDPLSDSLLKTAHDAFEVGYLDHVPSLDRIYELSQLKEALEEKGLPQIP
jgi:NitT/TauT family transport system substrate-binding protein